MSPSTSHTVQARVEAGVLTEIRRREYYSQLRSANAKQPRRKTSHEEDAHEKARMQQRVAIVSFALRYCLTVFLALDH